MPPPGFSTFESALPHNATPEEIRTQELLRERDELTSWKPREPGQQYTLDTEKRLEEIGQEITDILKAKK